MATKQSPLNATTMAAIAVPANPDRRFLYLRNYSTGTVTMWVAFGVTATAGNNGELEILPGMDFEFGGKLDPLTKQLPGNFKLPNCPLEYISIITGSSTASGCAMEQ